MNPFERVLRSLTMSTRRPTPVALPALACSHHLPRVPRPSSRCCACTLDAQTIARDDTGPPVFSLRRRRATTIQTRRSGRSASTFPEAALVDLRRRIAATRWPDRETVNDQSQGVQLAKLQALVRYWGTDYDWRKAEAKLNALPQFVTDDRRARHSVHPRPLASSERPAADHDARLARLDLRAPEGHRSAHRSHGPWRTRGRRLRPRAAHVSRLWLLGQADRTPAGAPTASRAPGTS